MTGRRTPQCLTMCVFSRMCVCVFFVRCLAAFAAVAAITPPPPHSTAMERNSCFFLFFFCIHEHARIKYYITFFTVYVTYAYYWCEGFLFNSISMYVAHSFRYIRQCDSFWFVSFECPKNLKTNSWIIFNNIENISRNVCSQCALCYWIKKNYIYTRCNLKLIICKLPRTIWFGLPYFVWSLCLLVTLFSKYVYRNYSH